MLSFARRRPLAATLAAGGTAAAAYALGGDRRRREEALHVGRGLARFSFAGYHGLRAAVDYKLLPADGAVGSPEAAAHAAAAKVVHKRSAERLLLVARQLGGMFTKIGQYFSTLTHILPVEWTSTLAVLQDKASARPWGEMARVFEEDLGRAPSAVFASIDEEPVAAASLAQVHRAVLKSGEEVAVKIQYPLLRLIASSDMRTLNVFFAVLEFLFPQYGYLWLFPEFEASVRNELNFLQEARNAQRVKAMFADDLRVYVPTVVPELTSRRVLVMEYIHGVKPTDLAGVRALGVDPKALASAVSRFFGAQVHVHGFVHCDPHSGNLLVRRSPVDGLGQLVVLDHGMYRRLSPVFRAGYCRLWKALLMRDDALGALACRELGVKASAYEVLSLMLLQRSASSGGGLGAKMSKTEVERLKGRYKHVTPGDINAFLQTLPRDLLFVSRNTNMVRGLNLALGGTARERFRITGQCAVRGLVLTDAAEEGALAAAADAGGRGLVAVSSELVSDSFGAGSQGLNPLTESELQALTGSAGSRWGSGRGGLRRQLRLGYEISALEFRLWALDVMWPFLERALSFRSPADEEARRAAEEAALEVARG